MLQKTSHATHLLKLLDKMYKYEMDPTRTGGATEWTRDAGRTDRQTDGRTSLENLISAAMKQAVPHTDWRTDGVKPIYPPTTSLCGGIIIPTPGVMLPSCSPFMQASPLLVPSHEINQCWVTVNWTLWYNFQENVPENVICFHVVMIVDVCCVSFLSI